MERITKTRDLMALCRSLETEGEERDINSLIESLARITYGNKQRHMWVEQYKNDCGITGYGSTTTMVEYVANVDNGASSQLSEGQKKKSKEIENLGPERVDIAGNPVKREAEYEGMKKEVVASEIDRGILPIDASGQESCSQGWSFLEDDFHDEKRKSKQKSQGRRAIQEPSIIVLRSSTSVFNRNRPYYQKGQREEGLKRKVKALKDGYCYAV